MWRSINQYTNWNRIRLPRKGLQKWPDVISFLAQEGDEVEIGATIAKIDESAEIIQTPSASAPASHKHTDPQVEVRCYYS